MTDLYLICHKVRGEPAFDIATRMECPECIGWGDTATKVNETTAKINPCTECDGLGYWWIIPTSGHRAYAWCDVPLSCVEFSDCDWGCRLEDVPAMPPNLPDHYTSRAEPKVDLITQLGLAKPPTTLPPLKRRF